MENKLQAAGLLEQSLITLNNSDCLFSLSELLHLARVFNLMPASNILLSKGIQNFKETMTNKLLLEQQGS